MGCSGVLGILSVMLWAGTAMYVGGGIYGLSGTMQLFIDYGPEEGRGNPGLDEPPEMWVNPETNKWESKNPNQPGNRVPKAFDICKYILIAWAVIIFVSSVIFIIDSMRSRRVKLNRVYHGTRTSDSSISCTAWLTGYCVFLILLWFIQAGFAVLPILEYRLTMQRCWDLENPHFATTTQQNVCVDLVQYGLVLFRETPDNGFALVCGPGGRYDPPRGDLAGFCKAYVPSFVAFVICFLGAGISTLALVLFTIHHSSNLAYLKVRRYEGQDSRYYLGPGSNEKYPLPPQELSRSHSLSLRSDYNAVAEPPFSTQNGVNLENPNYGSSVPESRLNRQPVPEVMSFQRYRPEEDDVQPLNINSNYHHLQSESESEPDHGPPDYADGGHPPSYGGESDEYPTSRHSRVRRKRQDRGNSRSHRNRASERGSRYSDGGSRRHRARESDEELNPSSDEGRSRRSRRTGSRETPDRRRDESPGSDYYMTQDRNRRSATRWG